MKEKQIGYIKAQIEDIDYLLDKANKGYEVGDVLKLESKKEQLENRLLKLNNNEKLTKEEEDENNVLEQIYYYRNKYMESEKEKRKVFSWKVIILLFIWMTIVAIIGTNNSNRKAVIENEEKENAINCYRQLLKDDEIYSQCEIYFQNDEWYKDYLDEVNNYNNLNN